MSNDLMTLELNIQTGTGLMKVTPMGLVHHHLPGATLLSNGRVFWAPSPTNPSIKLYINVETVASMLHYAREKGLNPVSEMYIIPSNAENKPASFKVKYTAAIERGRQLPGFLGSAGGLVVQRKHVLKKEDIDLAKEAKELGMKYEPPQFDFVRLKGEIAEPGDVVRGAWAMVFMQGAHAPIEWEISKDAFWGKGGNWDIRGNWMLCKTALDQCFRIKLGIMGVPDEDIGYDDVIEVSGGTVVSGTPPPQQQQKQEPKPEVSKELKPGEKYTGMIVMAKDRDGRKTPAQIGFDVAGRKVVLFFWTRPEAIKKLGDTWAVSCVGEEATFSFKEEKGYKYLDFFAFTPEQKVQEAEVVKEEKKLEKAEPAPEFPFEEETLYSGKIQLIAAPTDSEPGEVTVDTEKGILRLWFSEIPEPIKEEQDWRKLTDQYCSVAFIIGDGFPWLTHFELHQEGSM